MEYSGRKIGSHGIELGQVKLEICKKVEVGAGADGEDADATTERGVAGGIGSICSVGMATAMATGGGVTGGAATGLAVGVIVIAEKKCCPNIVPIYR
jgi:hypothetical protein